MSDGGREYRDRLAEAAAEVEALGTEELRRELWLGLEALGVSQDDMAGDGAERVGGMEVDHEAGGVWIGESFVPLEDLEVALEALLGRRQEGG